MKDHSHVEPPKCKHDLAFCEKCDKPYCKLCGLEWVTPIKAFGRILFDRQDDHKWPSRPTPPQWGPNLIPMQATNHEHGG